MLKRWSLCEGTVQNRRRDDSVESAYSVPEEIGSGRQLLSMLGTRRPSNSDSVLYFDSRLLLKRFSLSQILRLPVLGVVLLPRCCPFAHLLVSFLVSEYFRLVRVYLQPQFFSTPFEVCHHLLELVQRVG